MQRADITARHEELSQYIAQQRALHDQVEQRLLVLRRDLDMAAGGLAELDRLLAGWPAGPSPTPDTPPA